MTLSVLARGTTQPAESRVIFRTDPLPADHVNPPAEHPPSGVQIAGYRMAAQKHHTTTGDRTRGLGANRSEARPVIKIDNREVFAVDHRVTAPNLQSERTSRNRRGVRESKLQTFTEVPVIRDRGKVLAPTHTVELYHLACRLLLHVRNPDLPAGEAQQRSLELLESVHPLYVVGVERMQVATFDVHGGGKVQGTQRLQVERRRGAHGYSVGSRHTGARQASAQKVTIAIADRERRVDRHRACLFDSRQQAQGALALAHREHHVRVWWRLGA